MLNHEVVLNAILANACVTDFLDGDKKVYEMDLHCTKVRITATLTSTIDSFEYDINGVEFL